MRAWPAAAKTRRFRSCGKSGICCGPIEVGHPPFDAQLRPDSASMHKTVVALLVAAAIAEFKATGKPVVAYSDFYLRDSYYLASTADEVLLHKMGMVILDGYGRFRTYYKEGIDKLELDWNVFKVGEYKSAVEPYLRNDMSAEAREAAPRCPKRFSRSRRGRPAAWTAESSAPPTIHAAARHDMSRSGANGYEGPPTNSFASEHLSN